MKYFIISLFFILSSNSKVQSQDFSTVDDILESLYAVISGPAGERDWDLFSSLFVPTATMGAMAPAQDGTIEYRAMTPQGYVDRNGPYFLENGFWEEEIGRQTLQFGELVHVFSAYQYRAMRGDEEVKQRGINSIQLVQEDDRWWIVSIQWNSEREGLNIPKKMLKKG